MDKSTKPTPGPDPRPIPFGDDDNKPTIPKIPGPRKGD